MVNTSNWWLGHQALISPEWIDEFDWAESKLVVGVAREAVRDAPRYDPDVPVTAAYENSLHGHYGHTGHWPTQSGAPGQR